MNTAFYKRGLGLGMFLGGSVGYLETVSRTLSLETVNFARAVLFVFAIGAAIVLAFQLRKQEGTEENTEKKLAIPKINRAPKKMHLFFFLFIVVTFLVVLIFLLTNNTFPKSDLYMILSLNLISLYGLSFVFRILI